MTQFPLPVTQFPYTAEVAAWLSALGAVEHLEIVREASTATVWKAHLTGVGNIYAKAVVPAFGHEVGLTGWLGEQFPGQIPPLLLSDSSRGLMAMPDLGPTLRARTEQGEPIERWAGALTQFAALQRALEAKPRALLEAGAPDRRLALLPGLFEAATRSRGLFRIDDGSEEAITAANWDRIADARPLVERLTTGLAEAGIPETLHHDDFHANNVCVVGERFVFFDWAEAALAHPFMSAALMLRYARLLFAADEPTLDRFREAYLDAWRDVADQAVLRNAFRLAERLVRLSRALTWLDVAAAAASAEHRADASGAATYWMHTFVTGDD